MAKHRSHSIAFKRQIAQEFISGETLHGLAKQHDLSRSSTISGAYREIQIDQLTRWSTR